jgi:hypothetical protein
LRRALPLSEWRATQTPADGKEEEEEEQKEEEKDEEE